MAVFDLAQKETTCWLAMVACFVLDSRFGTFVAAKSPHIAFAFGVLFGRESTVVAFDLNR
ncbi:MAG: hypothetical protein P8Y78_11980 [Acidihalobacter sp.]